MPWSVGRRQGAGRAGAGASAVVTHIHSNRMLLALGRYDWTRSSRSPHVDTDLLVRIERLTGLSLQALGIYTYAILLRLLVLHILCCCMYD